MQSYQLVWGTGLHEGFHQGEHECLVIMKYDIGVAMSANDGPEFEQQASSLFP